MEDGDDVLVPEIEEEEGSLEQQQQPQQQQPPPPHAHSHVTEPAPTHLLHESKPLDHADDESDREVAPESTATTTATTTTATTTTTTASAASSMSTSASATPSAASSSASSATSAIDEQEPEEEGPLTGVTFTGYRFPMPDTPGAVSFWPPSRLKNPSLPTLIQLLIVAWNIVLVLLPLPQLFFVFHFLFWRAAYNLGLGLLLSKQSNTQLFTRLYVKFCTCTCHSFAAAPASPASTTSSSSSPASSSSSEVQACGQAHSETRHRIQPFALAVLRRYGLAPDFDFEQAPPEFNAWILFRLLVDVVLFADVVTYFAFVIRFVEIPTEFTVALFCCYVTGLGLCGFTLWTKSDAYRVVKDFAWYWGDFFFLVEAKLTFDRVFAMFPHPMYTVGYAFYYGMTLLSQSYFVLYVSVFAHFAQLFFLAFAENPHIEKTYPEMCEDENEERARKELEAHYFRSDLIVFKNFNIFRSSDLFMAVTMLYVAMQFFFDLNPTFYFGQAIFWRMVHSFGLGYILYCQSVDGDFVRSYLERGCTIQEAFDNWKKIYNFSLTMTWMVFILCAIKLREPNDDYGVQAYLAMELLGAILVGVNIWSSVSTFEVLGEYGWFFGDFFLPEAPKKLYYTGIYRFLNNPDHVTGCAGYYGMAIMSGSWKVFALALFSQASIVLFHQLIELPHMRRLYGNTLRPVSGIEMAFESVVAEAKEKPTARKVMTRIQDLREKAAKFSTQAKVEAEKLLEEIDTLFDSVKQRAEPIARLARTPSR